MNSTRRHRTLTPLAALALLLALPGIAGAKTFVIPHVFETQGRISNPHTFDTSIFITYGSGLAGLPSGSDHDVSLWLFASDGTPMRGGGGQAVCAPCTYTLTEGNGGLPATRKLSLSVDDLIMAAGGFGPAPMDGFAVIDVSNDGDPAQPKVTVHAEVVLSNTGPDDVATYPMEGAEACPPSGSSSSRVFVLPHIIEKSGTTTGTPFTFDTSMFITYSGGLAGSPPAGGATVDFYLYENNGSPMSGPLGDVCNPCSYDLTSARKERVRMDDLIAGKGAFDTPVKLGFGVIVVGGSDMGQVALQGFVVNSHTSAFDLAVFGFDPQPIAAATNIAVPVPRTGDLVLRLSSHPNPSRGGMDFAFDLARGTHVDLGVYDAAGRKVATVYSGRREAGTNTLRWDRRDDAGNPLAAGVYFGRIAAGDGTGLSRVVVLPE